MSKHNMNAGIPVVFRSYRGPANQGPDCMIWQALCATMAHPDLFKSFPIGDPPLQELFVDAGLGCNNPLAHVLSEVKAMYPKRHVASVISIGAGHTRTIQIPESTWRHRFLPTNVILAMKDIATDSERVAEDMALRFSGTTGVYFRFNVDQGMQNVGLGEWERLGEVAAHARSYLQHGTTSQQMDRAARAIKERKTVISTSLISMSNHCALSHLTAWCSQMVRYKWIRRNRLL
jgi:hypothetical protein